MKKKKRQIIKTSSMNYVLASVEIQINLYKKLLCETFWFNIANNVNGEPHSVEVFRMRTKRYFTISLFLAKMID